MNPRDIAGNAEEEENPQDLNSSFLHLRFTPYPLGHGGGDQREIQSNSVLVVRTL